MSLYESTFILRQDISVTEVNKVIESLSATIKDNEGKILKHEYWGLKGLAYTIKKNKKGHYVMLIIEAPHRAMLDLQRKIKLSEDVIRNLTLKIESFDKKDSIMMSADNDK
ncbi:MAG: 30S ribosomal protein S6 [Alphaproteobacteria bacterium]|nr:30S ribosomal protein S6 [Alphaproteobacteria bacterium]